MEDVIRIRGARQHNLKGIDLDLPRRRLTVLTGPSGSGKSSLALDTLYAEGQRRYIESLSTYAKQFLERMQKPAVDLLEGLSPAVAIEQKNPTKTSRSTVGTATEVYDYLRLLWSRVGHTHCPECGRDVRPDTVSSAVDRVLELPRGTRFQVTFPLPRSERVTHALVVSNLRAMGFLRVLADGSPVDLATEETASVDLTEAVEILVSVDRLKVDSKDASSGRGRLADSLGTAFVEGDGEVIVVVQDPSDGAPQRLLFTEQFRCPEHPDVVFTDPRPQLFSFNNPYGSCDVCTGFGATLEYDPELIVPDPTRSIAEGAVDPWTKPRYKKERERLRAFAVAQKASLYSPWAELPKSFRETVLYKKVKGFVGVVPFLKSRERKKYKQYIRVFLRRYQSPEVCSGCHGARLREEALWVKIGGRSIAEVADLPIEDLQAWVTALDLTEMERQIADTLLRELRARVGFLVDVGLGYLSLSRQTRTLSGGEAQRISLANSLGAALVDTLYVLDEPTVGLHPRDTSSLLDLLARLSAAGNTVVVVEHDPQAIRSADHVVELGPASGEQGGRVVFEGPPSALAAADTSTGRYLAGRSAAAPSRQRRVNGKVVTLRGARHHNLKGVDIDIPLGALTVVSGVSGSGKSTLVHDVLFRAAERELAGETTAKEHLGEAVGEYDALKGLEHVEEVVLVDQSPIGRTPRSNPVTYVKAWDEVRKIFAEHPLARQRGYGPGHFSFNVAGGRCEECGGAGQVEIEMVFLADVFVPCDACDGKRYKRDLLDVTIRGKNVSDVLDLTVDEAIRFFIRERRLGRALWHLQQVGLGYLRLGQPAPTLSGGESQRLKIARELAGAAGKQGKKLYILDEPTTGLSGEDVAKLMDVLDHLIEAGNTVLVIEHNLDVIRSADWLIDLGPGAGHRGGEVVAMGRPEDVAAEPRSATGRYLAQAQPAHVS
jgi:excinuclease ABC subunit A